MNVRFHAPDAVFGKVVALPEDEAQHLTRVLRLKEGTTIRVFDGRGHEFDAVVQRAGKAGVTVSVGAGRTPSANEPRVAVTLAPAVLKGDKMDDVVRDAVMMGVAAIQPVVTSRTEVSMATLLRSSRMARWRRIAVSSAKQCGRATLPAILEPRAFDTIPAALADLALPDPGLMLVEPTISADIVTLSELDGAIPREATILIGPEGGWTEEEIQRGAAACRLITLRGTTIRADAMPIVALAALMAVWKEL